MKKLLFLIIAIAIGSSAKSQVLLNETFDHIAGDTAGGAGTYSFPNGWLLANVDTLTPNPSVSYLTNAWSRGEDYVNNIHDTAAFSTSWYAPAGQADDWMVTPAIGPIPAGTKLSWRGLVYDAFYADGYEVRVLTAAPTGSNGNIGNLLSASTLLYADTAENDKWTNHSVSLNAFVGQTIYVAFRNNSIDKYLLLIDDVKVESLQDDAKLESLDTITEYATIPKSQVYMMPTLATVYNNGINPLTNVALKLNVYDGSHAVIYSNTGTPVASVVAGNSVQLSAGNYTIPGIADTYTFEYVVTHSGPDQDLANDTLYDGIIVGDSTFARDNGNVTVGLGLPAGSTGYIGEQFTLTHSALLSSVGFYSTKGYVGKKAACVLWDMSAGAPNAIIAYSDTMTFADDSARYYTLPVYGGAALLQPGTYTLAAVQFDSTLAIGQTSSKFTPGTVWINQSVNPLGTWSNVESFGSSFKRASVLRLNLSPDCSAFAATIAVTNATCSSCSDGSAFAIPSGIAPYTYTWSNGASTAVNATIGAGIYTVTITDALGCSTSATDTVSFTSSINEHDMTLLTTVYPNPGKGIFNIMIPEGFGPQIVVQVTNEIGQVIYAKMEYSTGLKNIDLGNLTPGKYLLKLDSEKYSVLKKLTVIK